jgi:hypothetical protein
MLYLFFLFVSRVLSAHAYLEENIALLNTNSQIAVSTSCTVYSHSNGTRILLHDKTQLFNVAERDKVESSVEPDRFHTHVWSDIVVVNNDCDLIIFGFPAENRVALWRPYNMSITYIVPIGGGSNPTYSSGSNNGTIKNVSLPVQVGQPVKRFGFSLDVQGQSWVVGAPGAKTNELGDNGSPGYAFVFEGDELHSCKSMYEMSCYPEKTGCVSGIEAFVNYYGKLKSPWATMFIPEYGEVKWKNSYADSNQLDITDVAKAQKLCLPMEIPYYKGGKMNQEEYDQHREVFQQFGYAVALSGALHEPGSALYISAPGDTSRFMENNAGDNYGRVYMWDNVIWPIDPLSDQQHYVTWWQPNTFTPLQLPLELATYQAFGRDIAASRNTLAISAYPLYEDTNNPFIILYTCNPEPDTLSNCKETGGISIDDIRGNPLSYLDADQITYLDGKPSDYVPVPPDDFQNAFIGNNIGIVGSNVIVADPQNNNVYRFSNEGEWRELHKLKTENTAKTSFATNSEHWVAETGEKKLTHYWSCPPGHTGPRHQCIPAQHAYYSDDGWELYSYPCVRNFTTTETGRWYCDPWSPPLVLGPTWDQTVLIMAIVISTTVACCILVGVWQFTVPRKYESVLTYDPSFSGVDDIVF